MMYFKTIVTAILIALLCSHISQHYENQGDEKAQEIFETLDAFSMLGAIITLFIWVWSI